MPEDADDANAEYTELLRARLEAYVDGKPFGFNPDATMVDAVLKAMTMRHAKFGRDYCPCRRVTEDAKEDAKIICPCVYHLDEIESQGHCHCHLFTKIETPNQA